MKKSVSRWKEQVTFSNGVEKSSKIKCLLDLTIWRLLIGGRCQIRANRKRGNGDNTGGIGLQKGAERQPEGV